MTFYSFYYVEGIGRMELTGKKQYIKEILFITALLVAGLAIAYWLDPIGQTFSQDKSFVSKQKLKGNTP